MAFINKAMDSDFWQTIKKGAEKFTLQLALAATQSHRTGAPVKLA